MCFHRYAESITDLSLMVSDDYPNTHSIMFCFQGHILVGFETTTWRRHPLDQALLWWVGFVDSLLYLSLSKLLQHHLRLVHNFIRVGKDPSMQHSCVESISRCNNRAEVQLFPAAPGSEGAPYFCHIL